MWLIPLKKILLVQETVWPISEGSNKYNMSPLITGNTLWPSPWPTTRVLQCVGDPRYVNLT